MLSGKRGETKTTSVFLNLIAAVLLTPTILAIYSAIRRDHEAYGAFGTILFFVGLPVYGLASSRALPMLSLSSQYASATTDGRDLDHRGRSGDAC